MEMIRSWEIKSLYGLADKAGLLDRQADEDPLHVLVRRLTGKDSIKKLTRSEYFKVRAEVEAFVGGQKREHTQAGVSPEQVKKAWKLMYRLVELDEDSKFAGVSAGKRMQGAIKKVCKVDAPLEEPFRFVSAQQMHLLIEQLKRYVDSKRSKQANQAHG